MADKIKFKKGLKANLPTLPLATPGFVTDEDRIYIGGLNGNIPMAKKSETDSLASQLAEIVPNTTLWYLQLINLIRTRAIISVQGFYDIDEDSYGKYRVTMVDGTETWTIISDGTNSFKISSRGEIAQNKELTTSDKKLIYIPKGNKVNVKLLGAKGDGVTDDTKTIQTSVSSLANKKGSVFLPSGNYIVTDNIKMLTSEGIENITIFGIDSPTSYNRVTSKQAIITFLNPTSSSCIFNIKSRSVCIKNLGLTGSVTVADGEAGQGIGINSDNTFYLQVENCDIDSLGYGMKLYNQGLNYIRRNNVSKCQIGIYGNYVNDSEFIDNWLNTNYWNYGGSSVGSNGYTGCAMVLTGGGNNKVTGGRIEWNRKGILLENQPGTIVSNIIFDANREHNLAISRSTSTIHPFSQHNQTNKGINIVGNKFLTGGFYGSSDYYVQGASIGIYMASHVNINGNLFSEGGLIAYDNNNGGTMPDIIGPKIAFIRVNTSQNVSITGNTFNSHKNLPPVRIHDAVPATNIISSVHYQGNESKSQPVISWYDSTSSQRLWHFYELDSLGHKRCYSAIAPATSGTFNKYDMVYNYDKITAPTVDGWICSQGGTFGSISGFTGSISTGTNTLTIDQRIDARHIKIDDYITIAGVTGVFKVLEIKEIDQNQVLLEKQILVLDKNADATVSSATVQLSAPTFNQF